MTPWDQYLTIWMRSGRYQLGHGRTIEVGCWGYERDGEYGIAREVYFINGADVVTRWRITSGPARPPDPN